MAKPCCAPDRPNSATALSGQTSAATFSHAYSAALRWTGARQSAATFSRGSANFTQTERPGRSTRAISEATPPVSGSTASTSAPRARPSSSTRAMARAARASCSGGKVFMSGIGTLIVHVNIAA